MTSTATASGRTGENVARPFEVVFVLLNASLEIAKIGKRDFSILNCDDHNNFLRKHKKDPSLYRPDILHQELMAILDSPLNKAGRVSSIYVETAGGVLLHIDPHTRLPRTFKRFCGLMLQLLQKLSIRSNAGPSKLLKVIKQPVTKYLPIGCRRIELSHSAENLVNFMDYVKKLPPTEPVVIIAGAMAHGRAEVSWADDAVSVSGYPLSGASALSRVCHSFEGLHGIV